ncbi:PH1 [Symbiodinium sp. KB8]|nr:PH1 [Symbiodinium sp. KB8]
MLCCLCQKAQNCFAGKPSTRIWLVARCCVGAYHGLVMSVPSPPAPQTNFTLVCVRRLEQEVVPDGGELSLSHDRCLLSRVDGDGRCVCYSCDNTRPEFSLSKPVAEEVSTCVWQHIPAETQVDLSKNTLSEYPGVACLVALHRDNAALTCCRFVGIETADAEVNTSTVELEHDPEELERGMPLLKLILGAVGGDLGSAGLWKVKVLREWYEGEESAIKTCKNLHVRISVATAQTLVLILDDAVATVLSFRWKGVFATHCFYMQRLCPSPHTDQRRALTRFSDVRTCRDWIFAVTPQPSVRLLPASTQCSGSTEANTKSLCPDPSVVAFVSAWHSMWRAARFLVKQSKHLKEWRQRWFVLTPQYLCSFKTKGDYRSPTESIRLSECFTVRSADDQIGKENSFCVQSVERSFLLIAPKRDEKELWISRIGRLMVRRAVMVDQALDSEMTVQVVRGEVQGLVYEWGIQDSWHPIHFTKAKLQVLGYTDITVEKLSRNRMWHTSGVAFHAILLGEYLPEEINFVTLAVARDLLAVALCDDRHRIWVISLDRYFEACPRGLDWDLLKERHRCTEGVGVMGQTSKLYQELTVFPEAFGLRQEVRLVEPSASLVGRQAYATASVMDCLVEGVPTYGISLPGGAYGIGDHFLDNSDPRGAEDSDRMLGMAAGSSSFSRDAGGLSQDGGVTRCMPFAWHERILQTRDEWLEVDRPRAFLPIGRASTAEWHSEQSAGLGDDDLNYNLCAAVHRHAQREYQNRLPPWLVSISLPRRAKRFNPPQLGSVGADKEDSSGSELVTEETENGDAKSAGSSVEELHQQASLEALRQELQPRPRFRCLICMHSDADVSREKQPSADGTSLLNSSAVIFARHHPWGWFGLGGQLFGSSAFEFTLFSPCGLAAQRMPLGKFA